MRLREIENRIVRLEHQNPNLKPGPHRYTDEELLHPPIAATDQESTYRTGVAVQVRCNLPKLATFGPPPPLRLRG